jgi:hypothetical protein
MTKKLRCFMTKKRFMVASVVMFCSVASILGIQKDQKDQQIIQKDQQIIQKGQEKISRQEFMNQMELERRQQDQVDLLEQELDGLDLLRKEANSRLVKQWLVRRKLESLSEKVRLVEPVWPSYDFGHKNKSEELDKTVLKASSVVELLASSNSGIVYNPNKDDLGSEYSLGLTPNEVDAPFVNPVDLMRSFRDGIKPNERDELRTEYPDSIHMKALKILAEKYNKGRENYQEFSAFFLLCKTKDTLKMAENVLSRYFYPKYALIISSDKIKESGKTDGILSILRSLDNENMAVMMKCRILSTHLARKLKESSDRAKLIAEATTVFNDIVNYKRGVRENIYRVNEKLDQLPKELRRKQQPNIQLEELQLQQLLDGNMVELPKDITVLLQRQLPSGSMEPQELPSGNVVELRGGGVMIPNELLLRLLGDI